MKRTTIFILIIVGITAIHSCKPEPVIVEEATPYVLEKPYNRFPDIEIPADNPMTVEGIALGRRLFHDSILSADFTQSCASCHQAAASFTDPKQFSIGVDGLAGNRNAMPVINLAWSPSLFWDGRAASLEDQALGPVPNPIEMHLEWSVAEDRLNAHSEYPELFKVAFGSKEITKELVVKAIAQFERTMISANSKYDRRLQRLENLNEQEFRGFDIFFTERGDCFHCHGNILLTDNLFHNNGLDSTFTDKGYEMVSGDPKDRGKFRTPTLRNVEFTAPYMHDGRFKTLEEVVEHYSSGVKFSNTIDPLMKKVDQGGLQLTTSEKADLVAFLKTFTDTAFMTDEKFQSPF